MVLRAEEQGDRRIMCIHKSQGAVTSPGVVSVNLSNTPRRVVLLFFPILQMQNLMIRAIKYLGPRSWSQYPVCPPSVSPPHAPLALNPWGTIMDTTAVIVLELLLNCLVLF